MSDANYWRCYACGGSAHIRSECMQAICPDCCANADHLNGERGHEFIYHRSEGWYCTHCGTDRNPSNYDYTEDYDYA